MLKKFVFLAVMAVPVVSFGQELCVNPGFETAGWVNSTTVPVLPGWVVNHQGNFSGVNLGGTGPAHGGVNWYGMGATSATDQTNVTQAIATVIGTTYAVSYWARDIDTQPTGTMLISFGGTQVGPTTATGTWTQYSANIVATSASTTLLFSGWEANQWVHVDDFSVQAVVPEPASMAVLGLGAVALIRRRRTRKS